MKFVCRSNFVTRKVLLSGAITEIRLGKLNLVCFKSKIQEIVEIVQSKTEGIALGFINDESKIDRLLRNSHITLHVEISCLTSVCDL